MKTTVQLLTPMDALDRPAMLGDRVVYYRSTATVTVEEREFYAQIDCPPSDMCAYGKDRLRQIMTTRLIREVMGAFEYELFNKQGHVS
jgi:hypothetical protein